MKEGTPRNGDGLRAFVPGGRTHRKEVPIPEDDSWFASPRLRVRPPRPQPLLTPKATPRAKDSPKSVDSNVVPATLSVRQSSILAPTTNFLLKAKPPKKDSGSNMTLGGIFGNKNKRHHLSRRLLHVAKRPVAPAKKKLPVPLHRVIDDHDYLATKSGEMLLSITPSEYTTPFVAATPKKIAKKQSFSRARFSHYNDGESMADPTSRSRVSARGSSCRNSANNLLGSPLSPLSPLSKTASQILQSSSNLRRESREGDTNVESRGGLFDGLQRNSFRPSGSSSIDLKRSKSIFVASSPSSSQKLLGKFGGKVNRAIDDLDIDKPIEKGGRIIIWEALQKVKKRRNRHRRAPALLRNSGHHVSAVKSAVESMKRKMRASMASSFPTHVWNECDVPKDLHPSHELQDLFSGFKRKAVKEQEQINWAASAGNLDADRQSRGDSVATLSNLAASNTPAPKSETKVRRSILQSLSEDSPSPNRN